MKKFLALMTAFVSIGSSQPRWTTETPPGYLNDYYVASGTSSVSASDARQLAFANALQKIIQGGTINIQASQTLSSRSLEEFRNGQSVSLDVASKIENEIRITGESQTIRGLREEETFVTHENGLYTVWLLAKIPKRDPRPYYEPSPLAPVWRSLIVPSWGQFYKGQSGKGYAIAISEVVLIPAGFIFNNLKITNESDAQNARTQILRDYYNNQANTYSNLGLGCFILAGAVYIYNVVDAIVSTGEKDYVESNQRAKPSICIAPQGLRLGVRFVL